MRVETHPPLRIAPSIASAKSTATAAAPAFSFTQPLTVRASHSMFVASSGSADTCQEACWPITISTGVAARRALWRLVSPLARPGPRCKRHMAGLPVILP